MPSMTGVSELSLTVCDLERSAAWYEQVFGLRRLGRMRDRGHDVMALEHHETRTYIILHSYGASAHGGFDPTRVGLHHAAFGVAGRSELEGWVRHLNSVGADHSDIVESQWGPVVLVRDPDGIQLELFARPIAAVVSDSNNISPAMRTMCPRSRRRSRPASRTRGPNGCTTTRRNPLMRSNYSPCFGSQTCACWSARPSTT
jgi:glyoxylase I family protein